ncbi:hypothetical protein TTHERM_000243819 (macronuclear) [Tetrahymena thermophila SB210]|uniref:Transmembrane protein n=1 Tax=Tetrahymena thermophila (strain SB210) TaxID=312017 RepID=W7X6Q2_TETTS|nr:hypothetical protein TTHERM_000243819 [Tetrahymena thermophila SB210]EWS72058.1 hypothetical protein TTHERM_000243819 [Tetrahymena thermophila SB210]|eukprot:XP_012655369.1 hypothetical protein TTHERM_000243819 [Tetrahymena thermophila SB210]
MIIVIKRRIVKIFIVYQTIWILINAQNTCSAGCLKCFDTNRIDRNSQCTQCSENFELDSKNNICVYSQCGNNLYYDTNQNYGTQGSCVAICSPFSQRNQKTNICSNQLTCSTSKYSQQNIQNDEIQDFFNYQDMYYVAKQPGYISVYDKNQLYLIKRMNFQAKDLNIFNINGMIFIISNDNSISIWDIKSEQRTLKRYSNITSFNLYTQIILMQNKYIFAYNIQQQSLTFEIIYDQINKDFCQSNSFIINISGAQSVLLIDQYLFVNNSTNIIVYQIIVQNNNKDLILQLQYHLEYQLQYQSNYYSILQTSNDDIYLLILAQSIFKISISSKYFEDMQIESLSTQEIVNAKMYQSSKADSNQYLIILTKQQLFYYDFSSQSSKLIIQDGSQITDFEVCSLWGKQNQIIVLLGQINLSVYYFDQDLQQFIQSNQIFTLNYQAHNLKLIQYQSQSNKELIQELVSTDIISILIIKKGSIEQQEQQQIQIITIANFNITFPTPGQLIMSNDYPHSILNYSPSMVIYANGDNSDIIFYDSSDESNCKLKRKIQLSSQKLQKLSLTSFFSDKVIAKFFVEFWIIDIYKQSVIKSFDNGYYLFATNKDKLVVVDSECLNVYSSNILLLYKNCQNYFKSFLFQEIHLNNDLRIFIVKQQEQNFSMLSLFQIDLDNQTLQKLNEIENINYIYLQVFQNFASQQDRVDNNYSIEQIFILDSQYNLIIYNMNLTVIYSQNQLKLSRVFSFIKVMNDNQVFVLLGQQQIILINIQTNNCKFFKIDYLMEQQNIYEAIKNINQYGKVYYQIKFFSKDSIYEYSIDMIRNITYLSGIDYVNQSGLAIFQQSKTAVSINTSINYFGGGDSGLLFISQMQKQRYSKLFLDKSLLNSKDIFLNILQSTKLGLYFVISNKQVSSFDIFTNKFIDIIFQDPNFCDLIKEETILICWNQNQLVLVNYSLKNKKFNYVGMLFLIGYSFDFYKDQLYLYGSSLIIVNSQLQVIYTILDEDLNGFITGCQNSMNKVICIYQDFDSIAYLLIFDKIQKMTQKYNLAVTQGKNIVIIY